MFLHVSLILFTGGWYPSMHCRSPGPHSGGKLRGLAWGGVSPGPHPGGKLRGLAWGRGVSRQGCLQAHTQGVSPGPHPGGWVSQHAQKQTPSSRQLLLRAVRILLECILVLFFFGRKQNSVN